MSEAIYPTMFSFVANYFIHSTLLLGAILLAVKVNVIRFDRLGEWLMKSALVLGLITAMLQTSGWINQFSQQNMVWTYQQAFDAKPTAHEGSPVIEQVLVPANKEPVQANQSKTQPLQQNTLEPPESVTGSMIRGQKGDGSIPTWLLLWLFGVLALLSKYLIQNQRFSQLIHKRAMIQDITVLKTWLSLLKKTGIKKPIKLTQCKYISTPIALKNEVVMPESFIRSNNKDQLKAALAHELAHIKRRDYQWLKFSQIYHVVTFFQPLNNLINQHIHQIAEQRADSLAANWTQNPHALASTLATHAKIIAEDQQSINSTQMVPAMTSKKSNLLLRVENLMNNQTPKTGRKWIICFVALLAFVLFTAPGVVAKTSLLNSAGEQSSKSHRHITIEESDDGLTDMSISYTNDERKLKLKAKIKGELQFNDDESEITSFPANSKFDLTIKEDGTEQRLLIKSNRSETNYTYYVDGDEQPYDAAAKAWFAQVIPEVLRTTGLDAEARVERIQKAHGDDAVLDEIELIQSDWVQKTYYIHLFNLSELNEADLERAMDLTKGISSDFELSHVLTELSATQAVESEAQWLQLLNSTDSIQSDFELAKTMMKFLDQLPQSTDINQAYFDAAATIQSDFELTKVLLSYIELQPANSLNMIHMFQLANDIQSDFELAKLLLSVNSQLNQSADEFNAYLELASTIQSDFEMKKVYSNLLKYELSSDNLNQMIHSAKTQISSDFELANLLLEILEQKQLSDSQKEHIIEAAKSSISSKFERNKVLVATL
ncbi:MAG: M56 family metallopeptidase [Marinicella sp.]